MSEQNKPDTVPSVDDVVLLPCPFCGVSPLLEQSFDIDCESTTAWITCEGCDCKYGPLYPDTKQDVIDWMEGWNKRRSDGLRNWAKAELAKEWNEAAIRPTGQAVRAYEAMLRQAKKLLDVPVGQ